MLKVRKCLDKVREYHSPAPDPALDLRLDLNESTTGCSPRVLAKIRTLDAKTLALYPPREFRATTPTEATAEPGAWASRDVGGRRQRAELAA